jgi:hypothetical protein
MRRALVYALPLWLLSFAACGSGAETRGDGAEPTLRVGEKAPGFALPAVGGGSVALDDYRGRKPVLLYFSMGPG